MKNLTGLVWRACVLASLIFTINSSLAQNGGYTVTERGLDYAVHQKVTVENGTNHVHKYVELATGLNYTNAYGQLAESKEEIDILPQGGAAAIQGRHQAYFPADINSGVIEVVTPDGEHLKSRPLALSYDDGSNTVMIAVLTNSTGVLVASNQVIYPNAFVGLNADLRYTYRKSGFEQDVVLHDQPPSPDSLGLNPQTATLQVLTEFFNPPEPVQTRAKVRSGKGLSATNSLTDTTLTFGKMKMMQGKAFAIGSTNAGRSTFKRQSSTPVSKSWLNIGRRTFLMEELAYQGIAPQLQQLPAPDAAVSLANPAWRKMSATRALPPSHEPVTDTNQILLASADLKKESGVVLDYDEIDDDQTDYTFLADTTYLISGIFFNLWGTNTIEGGAVLKTSEDGSGGFAVYNNFVCDTSACHPAVFTSVNDDSVGEIIDGSTGTPSYGDINFLCFGAYDDGVPVFTLHDIRFCYGQEEISIVNGSISFTNVQFVNCEECVFGLEYNTVILNNSLVSQCGLVGDCGEVIGNNTTFDQLEWGVVYDGNASLTNCILSNVPFEIFDWVGGGYEYGSSEDVSSNFVLNASNNGFYNSPEIGANVVTNTANPFESAAAANDYLAASSPFRDVGTTNIDSSLLAELQTMTTYAPQDGGMPDTNTPDLGYHYSVNEDSDFDGIPDWWIWNYFHSYAYNGTSLDSNGNTLLYDYQNGRDPDVIQFSIESTNDYVNTTNANLQLNITAGTPSYYAVFVNNATTTNWLPFTTTNLSVNLGTTDGIYDVNVGLKGFATNATQAWDDYSFTLDRVVPLVTITNPVLSGATATVIKPYLQLQGFANEPLASLSYDISNATGINTNQDAFVTDQTFDTNAFDFTTNYFQAYDVPLTNGANAITLRVTDRAGNMTTTNFTVTLDYTTATNPVIALTWPTNGMALCGDSFTLRGLVDDETATVSATIMDTNGDTNVITGEVERSGVLWVENLPLNSGTNWITLNVTNAAGLANTTNLYVVKSDMTLTVTSISGDLWVPPVNVYGTVSDTSAAIWVNGVQGTNYGDGTWEVDNVPVSASGVASFDVSAVPAGGGDPDFNTNVIKDAEVVIVKYQDNKSVLTTNAIYGDSGIYTRTKDYQLNYAANNSGQEFLTGYQGTTEDFNYSYNSYFDNYGNLEHDASSREDDYGWTVTNMYWSHTVDGVNGIYTNFNDSGVISVPDVDLYEFGWLGDSSGYDGYAASLIYHYYANNVRQEIVYADGTVENLAVDARTTMKLFTGGRAGVNRQSLICVSASATEYGRQGDWAESSVTPWLGVPESGVSASSIRVLGKNLGADGNLWVALPDGASPDLFIAAPPRHYNATATVQKYKMDVRFLNMGGSGSHTMREDNGYTPPYNCELKGDGTVRRMFPILYESVSWEPTPEPDPSLPPLPPTLTGDVYMQATPTFRVYSAGDQSLTIHGVVRNNSGHGFGCVFSGTGGPGGSGVWTMSAMTADTALPQSKVDFYNPLTIDWYYGDPYGQNFVYAGTTKCPVYVSLAPPTTGDLYHTVVHLACSAPGATTQSAALANTWGQFSGRGVTTWDGSALTYYKGNTAQVTVDLSGLLSPISIYESDSDNGWNWRNIHDGNCDAFAYLLQSSLQVNGLDAEVKTVSPPSGSSEFVVKNASFVPRSWYPINFPYDAYITPAGIPGQNMTTPSEKMFSNHKIIFSSVDNNYYDPSYGISTSSPSAYINSAIDGFDDGANHWTNGVSGITIH